MAVRNPLQRVPRWDRAVLTVVAALTILMVVYPLVFVVLRAFAPGNVGSGFTLEWVGQLFTSEKVRDAMLNTVIYTVGCTVLSMVAGVGLAFLVTRTDIPGRRFVGAASMLPMLVPPFILVVGWSAMGDPTAGFINIFASKIFGDGTTIVNVNSMPGIIWVTGLFLTPYAYMLTSAGFRSCDTAVEEAARVSGAGRLRLLRTVILPSQRPALLAALLLIVVMSAGDFVIPSTLGLKSGIYLLPSLIWQNSASFPSRPGLAAAQSLVLVLVGLVCIYFQRRALGGAARYTTVGGKGVRPALFALGPLRYPIGVVAVLFILSASVLPLLAVATMSVVKYWTATAFSSGNLTLGNFSHMLFHYPQVWLSVRNSLTLAVLGATLGMILAIAVSWYMYRMDGRLSPVVAYAVVLPLGIPGIALGLGILNTWILVPGGIYGTLWIMLLAYLTSLIPIALQFAGSALQRINSELEDASRIAGQPLLGTLRRIAVPLMRPAMISGWLLLYVIILREISLVILLYNPSTVVLSVGLLDVWSSGFYPELAVYSLLLVAIGLLPVAVLSRFARTKEGIEEGMV